MTLKGLKRFAAVLACVLSAPQVVAGETIATDSWEYEAPADWSIDRSATPPRSIGPSQELVQFSSQGIPSVTSGSEAKEIRKKVEAAALKAMQEGASAPDLKTTIPLTTTVLAPELTMHEIACEAIDGKSVLVQFALVGPHAIVLITYEARSPGKSVEDIRRSVLKMKWAA